MDPLFCLIYLIHVVIWLFVIFAFITPKTAYINLIIILPLIYIAHILPFHLLNKAKTNIYADKTGEYCDELSKKLIFPEIFINVQRKLEKDCFASPMSPQGLVIFGALTCFLTLKKKYNISFKDFKK
jgi:hypothetical protein